jgi:hypothetical protein
MRMTLDRINLNNQGYNQELQTMPNHQKIRKMYLNHLIRVWLVSFQKLIIAGAPDYVIESKMSIRTAAMEHTQKLT